MFIRIFALSLIVFGATSILAAPSGGRVTAGDGELSNPLNIIQHSEHLGTSWESFDIASGEVVNIVQPSASALISIKVRNGVETNIDGTLNANGKVALENPAGVLFGAGSVVNVGGLLASASAGAVQANGVINAPLGEVHLQSLSNSNVVNVGGAIEAQRIIVEGANEVRLGASARLTAAKEVLVGGGFQGNGTITNAQKTIVESGALITTTQKNGRVIIWSDVSTNFQGSINAKGGFVEVSGKQSLASFDIAKIKAAELLLDPENITIGTDTTNDDEISTANDGLVEEADGEEGETFLISAAAIQSYVGNVVLRANVSITVNAAITKSNGALELHGANIFINQNITITGHNLTASSIKLTFSPDRPLTLSGAVVSFNSAEGVGATSNQDLTITATGVLSLDGNYDIGTGNASLSFGGTEEQTPSPTSLLTDDLTLTHTGITGGLKYDAMWMAAAGRNLTLISQNHPVFGFTDANLGHANDTIERGSLTIDATYLFVEGGNSDSWTVTAKDISITSSLTSSGENSGFISAGGSLTLNATGNITISSRHIDFFTDDSPGSLALIAGGEIIFVKNTNIHARNLTLDGTIKVESTTGGETTLHSLSLNARNGGEIIFADDKATTITATGITFDGAVRASGQDLTLIAENGIINVESINLANADDSARGNLTIETKFIAFGLSATHTIKANNISLTATSEGNFAQETTGIESGGAHVTLNATSDITISSSYIGFSSNLLGNLTLIAGGEIVFVKETSIKAGDLTLGGTIKAESTTGDVTTQYDLTLDTTRGQIIFAADKATTITAANITLTSTMAGTASNQDLTLATPGTLTINGNYNIGTGRIVLTSDSTFPDSFSNIMRAGVILTYTGEADFTIPSWAIGANKDLTIIATTANIIMPASLPLGITDNGGDLRLEAQAGKLVLDDTTATTITAKSAVLISRDANTATNLDLTITTRGTLNIAGDFKLGSGSLIVSANVIEGGEKNSSPALSISAADITLNANSDFQREDRTEFAGLRGFADMTLTATGTLTLDTTHTNLFINLNGVGDNDDLTLDAPTIIFPSATSIIAENLMLGGAVRAETSAPVRLNLTIAPTAQLNFSTTRATSITGAAVSIASPTKGTASMQNLTLTASGVLTMTGNYDIGSAAAELSFAGTGAQNPNPTLLFANDITLTYTAAAHVDNYIQYGAWMRADGRNLTFNSANNAFLIQGATINLGTGNFIANALTLTIVTSDVTITANNITIGQNTGTPTLDLSSGNLILDASGDIRFNIASSSADSVSLNLSVDAEGDIIFAQNTTFSVRNLNIGGTIKAESGSGGATKHSLSLTADIITLARKTTTITGADITLDSDDPQTNVSDADLNITASGVLTLTGSFNIGTGDASLTFGGTAAQNPAPTSFLTDDLTLTYTSNASDTLYLGYAAWMAAPGRNLTLKAAASSIRNIASINLGDDSNPASTRGNLTLSGVAVIGADADNSADPAVITANDISITASSTSTSAEFAGFRSGGSITLDAANDITIAARFVNFNSIGGSDDLTLIAGSDNIFFPQATDIKTANLTLGGTLTVETPSTASSITITLSGALNFATDKPTTIRAYSITLISPTAGARSDNNLTLNAQTNITLQGGFDFGAGRLDLFAGQGESLTGAITFTATASVLPTISAASVLLEQNASTAVYPADSDMPATFMLPSGVKPRLRYTGTGTQPAAAPNSWFEIAGANLTLSAGSANITITTLLTTGDFAAFSIDKDGLLDFGGENVVLVTTGSIIFPDTIRTIRARSLTLTAASVVSSSGDFSDDLTIDIDGVLTLSIGSLTSEGALVLEASALHLTGSLALNATAITITATDTGTGADAAIRNVDNQSLSLTATAGDITLKAANTDLRHADTGTGAGTGEGNLTLLASGNILFPQASNVDANNITLSGLVKAELASGSSATPYNLSLEAVEKITFATGKPTTIEGIDITLASPTVQTTASEADLTVIASGVLTMSGNYNIGKGNAALTFAGTFEQAPDPDTLLTDDLTLTYTLAIADNNSNSLSYEDWMGADGRNLTVNVENSSLFIDGKTITLGSGSLVANVLTFLIGGGSTVRAHNITIGKDTDAMNTISLTGGLTLDASGDIRFNAPTLSPLSTGFSLTIDAEGEIIFAQETTFSLDSLTIGGTIKAESTNEGTPTQHDLTFIVGGKITFTDGKATTISGANISLTSVAAGDASNKDLTITATGNITLEGSFDIGNDAATGGTMTLTAGEGSGTGAITFTETASVKPTLAAKAIVLTQDGAFFVVAKPATFNLPNNGRPRAVYTGSGIQSLHTWFTLSGLGFNAGSDDINIMDLIANGSTLAGGNFASLTLTAQGLLDFGNEDVRLITTGAVIFPAAIREIRAKSLTLSSATIMTDDSSGNFIGDLKIDIADALTFTAFTLTNSGAVTLEGTALNLAGDLTISATAITIMMTGTKTGADAAIRNGSDESLSLTATAGDITLEATSINLRHAGVGTGEGNITLSASGEILLPQATDVKANNITLNGVVKAQSGSPATQHNLSLTAVDKITFAADRATTISGNDLTLISPNVQTDASTLALTLTAAGNLTLTGDYNIGGGDAALNYAAGNTPAPDSLTAANITLTLTAPLVKGSPMALNLLSWMTGATASLSLLAGEHTIVISAATDIAGRDITLEAAAILTANPVSVMAKNITIGSAMRSSGFNLGTGSLDLTASEDIRLNVASTSTDGFGLTLSASGNIIFEQDAMLAASTLTFTSSMIKAESTADNGTITQHNVTLNAQTSIAFNGTTTLSANKLTIGTPTISGGNLTLSAVEDITFTQNVSLTPTNLTLGGVVKAQSTSGGTATQRNLTLEPTGQLNFATDKATTITGADISLASPTKGAVSGQNLVVNAAGNLTLEGSFDVGDGTMNLTAGSGDTGVIEFTSSPTLKASAITLTQKGAPFAAEKPATFTIPSSGKPTIRFTGIGTQSSVTWADRQGIFETTDISLEDELDVGGRLEGEDEDTTDDVMINLGDEAFIINTPQNFILPNERVEVRAVIITITANSIRNAVGSAGISEPLVLVASQIVTIDANIDSSANIIIKAPQVVFSGTKPVRLVAQNIMIELPEGVDMPSDMPAANNQNVELVATSGDIMLNNNINVGFGTLKLEATGEIMTPNADITIMGNRVVLDAGTENTIGGGLTIISMNDIRLLGDIQTDGSILLQAGGSIITSDATTTIEATGASNSITFEQRYALRQSSDLTLKAAGEITIIGGLDRGTAGITLDGGTLDLTRASLIAGEITCLPIPVGASAGACQ